MLRSISRVKKLTVFILLLSYLMTIKSIGASNNFLIYPEEDADEITYINSSLWEINWKDLNSIFNYLSYNKYQSTYRSMDSYIYEIGIDVNKDGIKVSFPESGIYTEDGHTKICYSALYTENGYELEASSTDINELTDFLGINNNNSIVYNLLSEQFKRTNKVELEDSTVEQKLSYTDEKYTVYEKKVLKVNNKNDIYKKLVSKIDSGEIFMDLNSYNYLGKLENNYLETLKNRILEKNINLRINYMVLPNWCLDAVYKSTDNYYRVYNLKFIDYLNSDLEVVLNLDGVDKYGMKRNYFISVNSYLGSEKLKSQEVADLLGLRFDELVNLIDTKSRILNKNIRYSIFESENVDNFVSVTKARYEYEMGEKKNE